MILADTSVWIEHFRRGEPHLQELLQRGLVAVHPFILGELACGNFSNRSLIMETLAALPPASSATHEEVMVFIERQQLFGKGLGYVDVHLLASSLLSHAPLWTRDRKLREVAETLHTAYKS